MKRILSLDGGGIHGVFTLQILREIERCVGEGGPGAKPRVLADHFDLIAGTSTGAIIASMLSWGCSVDEVENFYRAQAREIFYPSTWYRRLTNKFSSDHLSAFLAKFLSEENGQPATLGTKRLRTLLLLVMRNATSGSYWPVTNNPLSYYNDRPAGMTNLETPLWKLVRASSAAPTYFPPQEITVGSREGPKKFQFIDGGVTPYNNPSYLAYLTATLPEYRMGFETGEDKLLLVSVGTGALKLQYGEGAVQNMHVVAHAKAMIHALMDSSNQQQDILCRVAGRCVHGASIDREIGALVVPPGEATQRKFRYARYNHTYSDAEVAAGLAGCRGKWSLDNLGLIPFIAAAGTAYAKANVLPGDLV
jgi:uncharacterized protein